MQANTTVFTVAGLLGVAWMTVLAASAVSLGQDVPPSVRNPAHSSYDVVALRVEFQPDTTRFTTGNGTFDGSIFDTLTTSIDPLPHDADYFRAHLRFLENYVRRVSDGQTTVETHLVPEIVRVPETMGAYSPTGSRAGSPEEQRKLARLVEDAWAAADRASDFDMQRFDPERTALVLFHAGAGRDIELVGTALNNTPEDIPSLYLNPDRFRALGGSFQRFNGFPVTHSLILPETESRLGVNPLTDEAFVAEFSINGMLAATFFNFLGVPDLYDTASGAPAIGPFGLMDPLGIFAYNGLFPPEPTAWTKYYLGWIDPPELWLGEPADLSLTAVGDTMSSDAALLRISAGEYFLVENRHRDPQGDGLHLEVWKDDAYTSQHIPVGTEEFSRFNPAAFTGGVLTDVDTYDWAVPGGTTEEGDVMYGGIAVWHVDERIVAEGLPTNTVNTNPDHRGVDLEEADGAQDLGHTAQTMFGSGSEQGTPFDLFFAGNPVRVVTDRGEEIRLYANRFGPQTRPSSANARGGPSFIEISDFSEPEREMSATARLTSVGGMRSIGALRGRRLAGRLGEASAVTGGWETPDTTVYVSAGPNSPEEIYRVGIGNDTSQVHETLTGSGGFRPVRFGSQIVALGTVPDAEGWVLVTGDERVFPLPRARGVPVGAPVVVEEAGADVLYAAFRDGSESTLVRWTGSDEAVEVVDPALPADIVGLAGAGKGRLVVVGRHETIVRGAPGQWTYENGSFAGGEVAFGRDGEGLFGVLADTTASQLILLDSDGSTRRWGAERFDGQVLESVLVSDLDGDAMLDVLVAAGSELTAFSRAGAVVQGFPIEFPAPLTTQPLLAKFAEGEPWTVIVGAGDGYLYARRPGSSRNAGERFPLAVGESVRTTPLLMRDALVAVSGKGELHAWRFAAADSVAWGQYHADRWNRKYVEVSGDRAPTPAPDAGPDLIVADRTYNWPNPVRDGRTHIRFVARRPSRVHITIVDMAGTRVDEISVGPVSSNVPHETTWETEVPSGVYYARVEAEASDGTTDVQLITIAVVR